MTLVYWDTMMFSYWLENNPTHARQVQDVRKRMVERGDRLCTSLLTLAEVLVIPHRAGDMESVAKIRQYFESSEMDLVPFNASAADRYAQIRASQRVPPADAIHLACAAEAGVDLFITNDHRLHRLVVPGIRFISGVDLRLA